MDMFITALAVLVTVNVFVRVLLAGAVLGSYLIPALSTPPNTSWLIEQGPWFEPLPELEPLSKSLPSRFLRSDLGLCQFKQETFEGTPEEVVAWRQSKIDEFRQSSRGHYSSWMSIQPLYFNHGDESE